MKTYSIYFSYSKNGKSWIQTSTTVKAESDVGAILQIKSKYRLIKDINIRSVK